MIDAINYHGPIKGVTMGTSRILRCHPFVKGGIDYVPRKFTLRRNPDENYAGPYKRKENKWNSCFLFLFELSEYSVDIVLEFGYSYKHLN